MHHPAAFGRFEWAGVYFDGRSAARHEVTIVVEREGLRITGARIGQVAWPFADIRQVDSGVADDPIRLERGLTDPEILVVADRGFLPAVQRAAPESLARAADPARRLRLSRRLIPITIGAVVLLIAGYLWGIPWLADRAARRVPVEWENSMGRAMVDRLPEFGAVCADPERVQALRQIVDRLIADGRGGRYTYEVRVIDSKLVNALAAPGGQIVVFQGLIAQAESPEELAGVLGHEFQHVRLQHGTKAILREVPMRLIASAVSSGGSFSGPVTGVATTLAGLRYSRGDEIEADREGMRMLRAARVAPDGMLAFFERMVAESGDTPSALSYVSSHPRDADRRAALEALARDATAAGEGAPLPLLTAAEWATLKRPCTHPAPIP